MPSGIAWRLDRRTDRSCHKRSAVTQIRCRSGVYPKATLVPATPPSATDSRNGTTPRTTCPAGGSRTSTTSRST